MTEYIHSPKVICITGPRAAGKTHVAKELVEKHGYFHIWLDGINGQICEKMGIDLAQVNLATPENAKAYADMFREIIKGNRYKNIVFEGERIRFPYILHTFLANIMNYYGEYAIIKGFSLVPDEETHYKRFMKREIERVKNYVKQNAGKPPEERAGDKKIRDFDQNLMPDPEGFEVVEDGEQILAWVEENRDMKHPDLPEKYADIIKVVADSTTYTPFYQTIEIDGQVIIGGMTNSKLSWENIVALNVEFSEKKVCDLGSMHGYFSFKIEEMGAAEVVGLELNESSVKVARYIARARNSKCTFEPSHVENDSMPQSDIIMAMNMLHWIKDLDGFLKKIGSAANELVMEIGDTQIKRIVSVLRPLGFSQKKVVKSHRPDKIIGQRYLFHFVKK